jgi:hypothetical protein
VVAVTVVFDNPNASTADSAGAFEREWQRWHCDVPLHVLHTEYASIVRPITNFVDQMLDERRGHQIVVLIPVVVPRKLRYRVLHNQLDVALSAALRGRTDLIVARVPMSLEELAST